MIKVRTVAGSALLPDYERIVAEIRYGWLRKETLWFDLPRPLAKGVNRSDDHWLTALLPLAFELGEDLQIHGSVDPLLLANAEKIQRVWAEWFPPRRPVRVRAASLTAPVEKTAGKTGLFFTGGVDSFFTLLHHDANAAAGQKIDDLIFVLGYDIPQTNLPAYDRKLRSLHKIAGALGKNVVPVATNLRQTRLKQLDWGLRLHGSALGAAGLLLGARCKTILLSSSQSPDILGPWGSHPLTTPLMSSGATRFVEYGGNCHRFEKTEFIARSEIALNHLHVCWREASDANCGHCEKCYRTLLALELAGRRAQAVTFPQNDFSLERVKDIKLTSGLMYPLFEEIRKAARAKSRHDVVAAVEACLAANAPPAGGNPSDCRR